MIKITGYKSIPYCDFVKSLDKAFVAMGKSYMQIAVDINVKTHATAINAFSPLKQKVSDHVLTGVMKSLELDGFVLSHEGVKYYYLKR